MVWNYICWTMLKECVALLFTANVHRGGCDFKDAAAGLEMEIKSFSGEYELAAEKRLRRGRHDIHEWCILAVLKDAITAQQARDLVLNCANHLGADTLFGTVFIVGNPIRE